MFSQTINLQLYEMIHEKKLHDTFKVKQNKAKQEKCLKLYANI